MVKTIRTIKAIALIAVLGTMAVGCQKESMVEPLSCAAESNAVRHVHYSLNGVPCQEKIVGEQAWKDFLYRMMDLAEQGYTVKIHNGNSTSQYAAPKDIVTYSTTSKDEAIAWCDNMTTLGYTVIVTYDPETGYYNCIGSRED